MAYRTHLTMKKKKLQNELEALAVDGEKFVHNKELAEELRRELGASLGGGHKRGKLPSKMGQGALRAAIALKQARV